MSRWQAGPAGSSVSQLLGILGSPKWVESGSVIRASTLKGPFSVALLRTDRPNTHSFKPKAPVLHNPSSVDSGAGRVLVNLALL